MQNGQKGKTAAVGEREAKKIQVQSSRKNQASNATRSSRITSRKRVGDESQKGGGEGMKCIGRDKLVCYLKKILRRKATEELYSVDGTYPRRWMPAVLIRKKTIREILAELEKEWKQ